MQHGFCQIWGKSSLSDLRKKQFVRSEEKADAWGGEVEGTFWFEGLAKSILPEKKPVNVLLYIYLHCYILEQVSYLFYLSAMQIS